MVIKVVKDNSETLEELSGKLTDTINEYSGVINWL